MIPKNIIVLIYKYLIDKELKSREKVVVCSKNLSDNKVLTILSYRMINT